MPQDRSEYNAGFAAGREAAVREANIIITGLVKRLGGMVEIGRMETIGEDTILSISEDRERDMLVLTTYPAKLVKE